MPLIQTKGAASAQGFGLTTGAATEPVYIEDVFSNFLFNGNSGAQTLNNGINYTDFGGMFWSKSRSTGSNNYVFDTERGGNYWLYTNTTDANQSNTVDITGFAYNSGVYLVSTTTGFLRSTNGTTWTAVTGSTNGNYWGNVQYLGGLFVAANGTRKQFATSSDGLTWTVNTVSTSVPFDATVLYANSRYMLTQFNTTITLVSTNSGASWTQGDTSSGTSGNYYYVRSVGSYFVAGGGNYFNTLGYSSDGINWSQSPQQFGTGATGAWSFPEAPNIVWMLMGYTTFIYSTNGVNWTTAFTSPSGYWSASMAYAPNSSLFYVYLYGFSGGTTGARTSSDGQSWSSVGAPSGISDYYPLGSDGTRIMIGSAGGTNYYYSSTGASGSWSSAQTAPFGFNTIFYAGGQALISTSNQLATSNNITSAWATTSLSIPAAITFTTDGVTLTSTGNANGYTYGSWAFREQEKFFDIVTAARVPGQANGRISHNLGSVPGFVIVKSTDYAGESWRCYHRSIGRNGGVQLNVTNGAFAYTDYWGTSDPTSTDFGINWTFFSGNNYIFYFFAHDAGGFGLTGTDNVISCGSFTTDGSGNATVNLGYEPQWVLYKRTSSAGSWLIVDNMRGDSANATNNANYLLANTSDAEGTATWFYPTATGFTGNANSIASTDFIYIAIRRGPMKVPTTGTSVFAPVAQSTSGSYPRPVVTNFPVDFVIMGDRSNLWGYNWSVQDRLRGNPNVLFTSATTSENTGALSSFAYNTQFGDGWVTGSTNGIYECFRRAPGFMDVVCYTGTGSNTTQSHNLGVVPELMIVKVRDSATNWAVYSATVGNNYYAILNLPDAPYTSSAAWNNTTPTSSVFTVGTNVITNGNGYLYVAYLFATCPGVSKVGSYTGTGTTLQVNCGFTSGARFVMIKRTDSTGDWYVWDSARGIVAGNDPYLLLNSTAAEVTNTDYVDTYSAGFEISSTAPAAINASGGSFIFLAIA